MGQKLIFLLEILENLWIFEFMTDSWIQDLVQAKSSRCFASARHTWTLFSLRVYASVIGQTGSY